MESSSAKVWNNCRVYGDAAERFGSLRSEVSGQVSTHNHVHYTQSILPLARIARNRPINPYCPSTEISEVGQDMANKDCLVRLYLRNTESSRRCWGFFILWNMIMHMDQ